MRLHPESRELYKLRVVTVPPALAVEASFDGGASWHAGQPLGDSTYGWLVAGQDADPGAAVAVLTESASPWLRWTDNPEAPARPAPGITVSAY